MNLNIFVMDWNQKSSLNNILMTFFFINYQMIISQGYFQQQSGLEK